MGHETFGYRFRNKAGFVSWAMAKAKGFLRGFPKVGPQDLSHRLSHLLCIKYNPEGLERKKKWNKTHPPKKNRVSYSRRLKIFKGDIPENIRKKYGHKSREKWTGEQKKILLYLVEKYRKTPITVDWRKLMKDALINSLPEGYSLAGLRSYYWRIKRPPDQKKRRKQALAYKYAHYKKYCTNQKKNIRTVRNSVRDFLFSKLETQ
jgi:hypothetical protein